MPEPVKMAFERQIVVLPLSNILPIKRVPDTIKQAVRYKRIVASIGEVGIVEPLVVARRQDDSGPYMLVCATPRCRTSRQQRGPLPHRG